MLGRFKKKHKKPASSETSSSRRTVEPPDSGTPRHSSRAEAPRIESSRIITPRDGVLFAGSEITKPDSLQGGNAICPSCGSPHFEGRRCSLCPVGVKRSSVIDFAVPNSSRGAVSPLTVGSVREVRFEQLESGKKGETKLPKSPEKKRPQSLIRERSFSVDNLSTIAIEHNMIEALPQTSMTLTYLSPLHI
jgi:hypothetical protein